ncbi:peptidase S8 [Halogeometricum borinquense]|uniref:Subtilisin-like serine protease n=3 Tax=Halogeometricum borinquense TaxID=60847 RepID=E4NP12_HALBP|nr:S8 family peptidase [Halogeometricum borinquense]ADQ66443.1 subtilisin-like serine protease [Halogeometricum borinquense DSM 11551]RYJ15162.1 peptidase S8 [Halogeometricum borinquense]
MPSNNPLRRRSFLKSTAALSLLGMSGVVSAKPGRNPGPKKDEILVGVSKNRDTKKAVAQHVPGNAEIVHENKELSYAAVKFPSHASTRARENFISAVTKGDDIKYAERNTTHSTLYTANDPKLGSQYAPQQVNANDAWDTTLGSSDVTVAVVDQGVKYDHPDLSARFGSNTGYDFVDDDSDPMPDVLSDEFHGTHVAGIAAGTTDNNEGVGGISNSTLLSGRALSESGRGSTSDIADAIQWAADQGADVVNLSLGGGGYTQTMKNAVSYATTNGTAVIAAAGNDSSGSVSYPAAYSEAIAVSALDPDETLASYSNYGSKLDLAAPGTNVLSCWTTSTQYKEISGTSMATPVVSGVAALALSEYSLSPADLRQHLKNTAVNVGLPSNKQGAGRVDAANAVNTSPSPPGNGDSKETTRSGSLSSRSDSDGSTYSWAYSSPSQVVLELSGPSSADFDLYASEGTGTPPTTRSFDHRSWTTNSQEQIVIDNPDSSAALGILVDSYSGSGDYTLTITEKK